MRASRPRLPPWSVKGGGYTSRDTGPRRSICSSSRQGRHAHGDVLMTPRDRRTIPSLRSRQSPRIRPPAAAPVPWIRSCDPDGTAGRTGTVLGSACRCEATTTFTGYLTATVCVGRSPPSFALAAAPLVRGNSPPNAQPPGSPSEPVQRGASGPLVTRWLRPLPRRQRQRRKRPLRPRHRGSASRVGRPPAVAVTVDRSAPTVKSSAIVSTSPVERSRVRRTREVRSMGRAAHRNAAMVAILAHGVASCSGRAGHARTLIGADTQIVADSHRQSAQTDSRGHHTPLTAREDSAPQSHQSTTAKVVMMPSFAP